MLGLRSPTGWQSAGLDPRIGEEPHLLVGFLGTKVPGRSAFNHSSEVVFDEDVLSTGAALLLLAADGWFGLTSG